MSSLNQVQLIGRVGKKPEIRVLNNGNKVATFSLATTEKWKDDSGNKQEKTEWHNIVAWQKLAGIIEDYVEKGQLLWIQGAIQTRSWDKDGNKHYITEIVAKHLQMLSRPEKSNNSAFEKAPSQTEVEGKAKADKINETDGLPF